MIRRICRELLGAALVLLFFCGPAAGEPTEEQQYCLQELCSQPQASLARAMKRAGIPRYPDSCARGFGAGSDGFHGTFLAFDDPDTIYRWYLKHLEGWHKYVSPMYPDENPVLYKGPAPETMSEEELAYLNLDELPVIEAKREKTRHGMCDFPTVIEIMNVPAGD